MGHNFFFHYAVLGIVFPFLSPVLLEYGFSKQATGLIQSGTFLCATLIPLVSGRLSDRYFSADQLIRFFSIFIVIFVFLFWWWSDAAAWLFLALLMLFSCTRGAIIPLQDTLAMHAADNDPKTYAHYRMMAPIGFAVSSTVSGWLVGKYGLNAFFPLLAVSGCLLMASGFFIPKEEKHPTEQRHEGFWRDINLSFVVWIFAMTLHFLCLGPYLYGFTLLLEEQEVSHKAAGLIWSLAVPAEVVILLFSGVLFRRFNFRTLLMAALLAHLVRWGVIGLYPKPWAAALTQLLHGPGFSLFYVAAMQALHHYNQGNFRASYQGLFGMVVVGLGPVFGMTLAGYLHESMSFDRVFLWFLPCQVLAILLCWLVPLKPPLRTAVKAGAV